MLALDLPEEIAAAVSAQTVAQIAGVETGCGGITYPSGGWLYPQQLTAELFALAATRGLRTRYQVKVTTLLLTMTAGSSMSSCVMRWWCWQTAII
jgi:tRNA 5-methylaminomethyl-2-thiouridine biosynthesis bifunctional protein